MEIIFKVPDKTTPGYLRRSKKALEFAQKLGGTATPELIDEMVDFLVDYVSSPTERDAKIEALWDATEEQFGDMLSALTGGGASTVPPENDDK